MRKILTHSIILFNCLLVFSQQEVTYPFQNSKLPAEQRISNLLSLMTLDEKVQCLSTNPSVPRLGVQGTSHVEGLHGLALGGPAQWGGKNKEPITTTTFPQSYGLGATWDVDLIKRVAEVEAYETRYAYQKYNRGGLVVRAPNADLARDPRWGRTEESYGEDPFLTGSLTVAFVKGLQGNDDTYWQTASLMKHFLANSNEDGRTYTSSDFDERLWREYYSVPFRMGIQDGGSRAYMAAYNKVNGIPAMVHHMLKNITVKEWGQNGIICTDGGAFKLLLSDHKYYDNQYLGGAAAVKSGINQFLDEYIEGIYGALANGYLTEKDIDDVLRGNFRVMLKLGMLDDSKNNPYAKIGTNSDEIDPWLTQEHQNLALEATLKSIVLLKNDPKVELLPLQKQDVKTIAVIGRYADEVLLDWYSGTPPYTVSILKGLQNVLGNKITILTATDNADGNAVAIAEQADLVIVVTGNHPVCNAGWADCPRPDEGKESVDRQSLQLPDEDLIKLVYQANPKTIVALVSSFPYAINWTQEHVPAIIHMTQNSQESGNAFAQVIFGNYNPAGRLTQTWVKSITDLPPLMDYNIRNGRTYMYIPHKPLYAFGHGLSYTKFSYRNLKVDKDKLGISDTIKVSVSITNTGNYDGEEVVQLYVKHLNSIMERPLLELKGFTRIFLKTGETKGVIFPIYSKDLTYWNTETQQFELENTKMQLQIGAASDKIKLKKIITNQN